MKTCSLTRGLAAIALFAGLAGGAPALAGNPAAPGSEVIWLLKDCSAADHNLDEDCFQDVAALQEKIWGEEGLHPTAETPLVVDIGPGDFSGTLQCPSGGGHVTFRGMGREHSRLIAGESTVPYFFIQINTPLRATSCEKLEFQDLALIAPYTSAEAYGVAWDGGGTSTWTNIDIDGGTAAWYDVGCGPPLTDPPIGEHYFFGSRLIGRTSHGFFAACDRSWFYGSEVQVQQDHVSTGVDGVSVGGRGEVQMFGSVVRVSVGAAESSTTQLYGVRVGQNTGHGEFHMHGGIIAVDASRQPLPPTSPVVRNAIGIDVNKATNGDGKAHTFETAWTLKAAGAGTVTRLKGNGDHESPFVWESGTDVPVPGLVSLTGADMFVETDCNSSGCSGGSDPHLMIYKAGCSSKWFDLVRQACR